MKMEKTVSRNIKLNLGKNVTDFIGPYIVCLYENSANNSNCVRFLLELMGYFSVVHTITPPMIANISSCVSH